MACGDGVRGARPFSSQSIWKGLHFCSYITTSNRNYVLNHVSYHRLRCAVDGRVVAAPRADHGAPAPPGPAGGRRRCRRVELTRARSHREEAAVPPGHEFRQGAGRPGLHDRHPRARPVSHRSPTYSRFDPRRSTTRRASRRGIKYWRASVMIYCPPTRRNARSSTSSSSRRRRASPAARTPCSPASSSRRAA